MSATVLESNTAVQSEWMTTRRLFFAVVICAALFYTQFQLFERPVEGDRANWDYFAQVIARGGVAYRDVVNIKTPLSAYLSAAAIVITKPFGVRDIYAIRLLYGLLAALTVGLTFLVAGDYFRSRRVGLLAAFIMLAFYSFARFNAGTQPKTPMLIFGLLSLWATYRDKPFQAGLYGMLSALSWQPGLLFVGVAGLAASRYLTRWREGRLVRVVVGALVPLGVLLVYFWASGALTDFYIWTWQYNTGVYAPREMRSLATTADLFRRMLRNHFSESLVYFYLAPLGLLVALGRAFRDEAGARLGWRAVVERAPQQAIIIAPLVYLAFCLVNMQGGADLAPLLPFVAGFTALLICFLVDKAARLYGRWRGEAAGAKAQPLLFAAGCLVIVLLSASRIPTLGENPVTIAVQDARVKAMLGHVEAGETLFVQGQTEILVLSGMANASKYFFLDRGKDSYLDVVEPGGFAGWFARLQQQRPKIVALARMRKVDHKADFERWVQTEYNLSGDADFIYYVRHDGKPVQQPPPPPARRERQEEDGDN